MPKETLNQSATCMRHSDRAVEDGFPLVDQ